MSEHKTFFGKIIAIFTDIFNSAAKKLWESLSEQEQADLKNGSGVLKVINDNIDKAPEDVIAIIEEKYPSVPISIISELAAHFNLNIGDKVEDAIASLQAWLKSKEGSAWDNVMNIAAQTLAFFLSGKEQKPGIIASLIEKVYRWFVKE